MGLNEALQLAGFVHRAGGSLYGSDDLVSIINHPMGLIAQPAL
jgi:hypothetical protein